jgi:hypothetical protein
MLSTILSTLLIAPGGQIQPNLKFDFQHLPPGMTQLRAKQLVANAMKEIEDHIAVSRRADQQKLEDLMASLEPTRKKLEKTAASDPAYKAFQANAKHLMTTKKGPERISALNDLFSRNQSTVKHAFDASGGSANDILQKVRSKFPRTQFQLFLPPVRKASAKPSNLDLGKAKNTGTTSNALPTKHTFSSPYAVTDSDTHKSGPGFKDASADVSPTKAKMTLSVDITSVGLGAGAYASGTAGVIVDVPKGFKWMKVSVYYDYTYKAGVWAAAGAGQAKLYSTLFTKKVGSHDRTFIDQLEYESSVAVVAWYDEQEHDQTDVSIFTVDVPSEGGQFLVLFDLFADGLGIGGGGCGVDATFTPRSIEVDFKK